MKASRLTLVLLGLGIVTLAGCGGAKKGELTGTITLKNQPLENGVVTLFPEKGEPKAVFIIQGTYTFPAVDYGNYKISVSPALEDQPVTMVNGKPAKPGEANGAKTVQPRKAITIPDKYHSIDTSGLRAAVDQPKVTHPIALD